MSYSQEIYDAVRSRISNTDLGGIVERVARESFDLSWQKTALQEQISTIGYEYTRPSAVFRPRVSLDGDKYCVLYGEDLMSGCAGFGQTMAEAMTDFDVNWFNLRLGKGLQQ